MKIIKKNNHLPLEEINKELRPLLKEYNGIFKITASVIFISAGITLVIIYTSKIRIIIGISGLLYTGIIIINLLLIIYYEKKLKKKLDEILETEKNTRRKILDEVNHKLLPPIIKWKRNKIQFIDEQESP